MSEILLRPYSPDDVERLRGSVRIGSEGLYPGDAARITRARDLEVRALDPAEILVWEMRPAPRPLP